MKVGAEERQLVLGLGRRLASNTLLDVGSGNIGLDELRDAVNLIGDLVRPHLQLAAGNRQE